MRTCLNAVVALGAASPLRSPLPAARALATTGPAASPSRRALTLTMANGLYRPEELQPFADEVARLSGGKMRIEFRNRWLGWPWRRPESAVIHDVAAGKADLGSVGSRAWDDVGVSSFNALHAPLLVDSYALQGEVLESGIPGEMLKALEPLRLVGLGILPGPLRKLLGVRAAAHAARRLSRREDRNHRVSRRTRDSACARRDGDRPSRRRADRRLRRDRAAGGVDREQHVRRGREVPDDEHQPLAAAARPLHERGCVRGARAGATGRAARSPCGMYVQKTLDRYSISRTGRRRRCCAGAA